MNYDENGVHPVQLAGQVQRIKCPEELHRWSTYDYYLVRLRIAQNSFTSQKTLMELTMDKNLMVSSAAEANLKRPRAKIGERKIVRRGSRGNTKRYLTPPPNIR